MLTIDPGSSYKPKVARNLATWSLHEVPSVQSITTKRFKLKLQHLISIKLQLHQIDSPRYNGFLQSIQNYSDQLT